MTKHVLPLPKIRSDSNWDALYCFEVQVSVNIRSCEIVMSWDSLHSRTLCRLQFQEYFFSNSVRKSIHYLFILASCAV